ncbi:MAG: hypothetical protein MI867_00065 [Pseudomonadales bacterium]|nr:hypothetical protein [Pseudomonadales bacterium]
MDMRVSRVLLILAIAAVLWHSKTYWQPKADNLTDTVIEKSQEIMAESQRQELKPFSPD